MTNLPFNPSPSRFLHLDINSAFATIEQQANPRLRGRPIGVSPSTGDSGCVIAASVEAKRLGVRTGDRVGDARRLCPDLKIVTPDPNKYRHVHHQLKNLLETYSPSVEAGSIDEFVVNFSNFHRPPNLHQLGSEIKQKIKNQIGDYITVSIGLAPNAYLAKIAAGLKKPDGLEEITHQNFGQIYKRLVLTDLTGIAHRNQIRLNYAGIHTVTDFYNATLPEANEAFQSKLTYHWYLNLRGYTPPDPPGLKRSVGHSHVLHKPIHTNDIAPLIHKFTHKISRRLKKLEHQASIVTVYFKFDDGSRWSDFIHLAAPTNLNHHLYLHSLRLIATSPRKPVKKAAVSTFFLVPTTSLQLNLFENNLKLDDLEKAVDRLNSRYGIFTIGSTRLAHSKDVAPDSIAFGKSTVA